MTTKEAVALLERYSNYDGMGITNLAGCKEAMRVAVDTLKEACPELAESEDERIRKKIIENVRLSGGYTDEEIDEMISWLEKHSEEEIQKIRKEEYTNGFNDAVGFGKQREQKPISQEDFDTAKHEALWGEQKPEWGEEDGKMLDAMIDMVSNSLYEPLCPREKMLAWLKSLRPSWKPSEEQDYSGLSDLERAIHRGFLCAGVENVPVAIIKETAQDCIASLPPSWKPNAEQMATLRRALHINPANGKLHELKENEVCILQSLLRELEKL